MSKLAEILGIILLVIFIPIIMVVATLFSILCLLFPRLGDKFRIEDNYEDQD